MGLLTYSKTIYHVLKEVFLEIWTAKCCNLMPGRLAFPLVLKFQFQCGQLKKNRLNIKLKFLFFEPFRYLELKRWSVNTYFWSWKRRSLHHRLIKSQPSCIFSLIQQPLLFVAGWRGNISQLKWWSLVFKQFLWEKEFISIILTP